MHAWMYILYIYICVCVCVCVCVSVEYILYIYISLCNYIYIYTSLHSTPLHAKLIQPIVNYCNSTSKKKHSNLPLLWIRILPFYLFGVAIVQPTASIHLDKISWFTNLKKKARPFQRGIDIYIYMFIIITIILPLLLYNYIYTIAIYNSHHSNGVARWDCDPL